MTPFVQLSAVSVPQPLPTSELVTMPHPTVRVISDAQSPLILTKLHNSGKLNYLTQVNEPKQQINGDKHDDLSPLDTRSILQLPSCMGHITIHPPDQKRKY